VLARGPAALKGEAYCFGRPDRDCRTRKCPVRWRPRTPDDPSPTLPTRPVGRLLHEAMKGDKIVSSTDHPVYHSLTSGSKL
jgi:hypothetical protein